MSNPVAEASAGAVESPVEEVKPISEQEWIAKRQAAFGKAAQKAAPAAEEPKPKEEAPSTEGESAKPEAEAPGNDVLSKAKSGNLDDLTEDELSQLAKSIGSKAVARFGELTAKRKAAEEEAARLRAELASREQGQAKHEPIANNPYTSLKTSAEVAAKDKELKEHIDILEQALDAADGLGANDTIDGTQFTKKEVKDRLRAARKARDEYLPDIAQRLQKRERAANMRSAMEAKARTEIPWLADENDERTKRYKATIGDDRLKKLEEADPETAATLPYFFAHAANSMFTRREIPVDTVKPIKPTPPSNPGGGAAASARPDAGETKQLKELESRAAKSGRVSDWQALRSAKFSKRKLIS